MNFFGGFPFEQGNHFQDAFNQEQDQDYSDEESSDQHLYEILQVDPSATQDQIKRAYRQKAIKMHPDKGGDPEKVSSHTLNNINTKFREISEAYEILSDEQTRAIYDKFGRKGLQEGRGRDPFSEMFGQQQKYQKVRSIVQKLNVTLEDIYIGKMFNVRIKKQKICDQCDGKGGSNSKVCGQCDGKKVTIGKIQVAPGLFSHQHIPCDGCKQKGFIIEAQDICKSCDGNQLLQVEKDVEVAVEKGVSDKQKYDMVGMGDEYPGCNSGDVIVIITIETHSRFIRKGADLYYQQTISLKEALIGCHFIVKHLDDENLFIATRPGDVIKSNQLKMIRGKGMPFRNDSMNYGNLFIQFNIEFPPSDSLSQEQLSQLSSILPGPQKQKIPENVQVIEMEEFDLQLINTNTEGGTQEEQINSDEPQGGVQCAQQ